MRTEFRRKADHNWVHSFHESADYEHFMGRWSRAAGAAFLDWLAPPANARWLDVGCGTGIFTGLVLDLCGPAAVFGIDPSESQVAHARRQPLAQRANFRVADAQALPFSDSAFDVVASALVMNFIPDPAQALSEMRRVTRPGGGVAAYVWDFETERSPSWPIRAGMRQLGMTVPAIPGVDISGLSSMRELFAGAGLEDVVSLSIDVTVRFRDFDQFWRSQTTRYSPTTTAIEAMPSTERDTLKRVVQGLLAGKPARSVEYSARANATKAHAPRLSRDVSGRELTADSFWRPASGNPEFSTD